MAVVAESELFYSDINQCNCLPGVNRVLNYVFVILNHFIVLSNAKSILKIKGMFNKGIAIQC